MRSRTPAHCTKCTRLAHTHTSSKNCRPPCPCPRCAQVRIGKPPKPPPLVRPQSLGFAQVILTCTVHVRHDGNQLFPGAFNLVLPWAFNLSASAASERPCAYTAIAAFMKCTYITAQFCQNWGCIVSNLRGICGIGKPSFEQPGLSTSASAAPDPGPFMASAREKQRAPLLLAFWFCMDKPNILRELSGRIRPIRPYLSVLNPEPSLSSKGCRITRNMNHPGRQARQAVAQDCG